MILVVGTFRVDAARLNAARPAMAAMIAASRDEAGCLAYSYAEDVLEPGLIHVVERWTDRAALDAHVATAHIAEWRAQWPTLGLHDRDLAIYHIGEVEPF